MTIDCQDDALRTIGRDCAFTLDSEPLDTKVLCYASEEEGVVRLLKVLPAEPGQSRLVKHYEVGADGLPVYDERRGVVKITLRPDARPAIQRLAALHWK